MDIAIASHITILHASNLISLSIKDDRFQSNHEIRIIISGMELDRLDAVPNGGFSSFISLDSLTYQFLGYLPSCKCLSCSWRTSQNDLSIRF